MKQSYNYNQEKSIFIPFNTASSKNSQRIVFLRDRTGKLLLEQNGNPKIKVVRSHYTSWYIKNTDKYFRMLKDEFHRMIKDKPYPIKIQLLFYRQDEERCDFNNLTQVIQDQMKTHGWITDDSFHYLLCYPPLKGPYVRYDELNPGTLLTIL